MALKLPPQEVEAISPPPESAQAYGFFLLSLINDLYFVALYNRRILGNTYSSEYLWSKMKRLKPKEMKCFFPMNNERSAWNPVPRGAV